MGSKLTLTASDGHSLGAYRVDPDGGARGGIVVLQEIFGVNAHIRDVCDRFAEDGYAAIAPALYDRSSRKHAELTYTKEDVAVGRKLREEFSWDDTILDVQSAAAVLSGEGMKVGTVGYCWGGSISYLAAKIAAIGLRSPPRGPSSRRTGYSSSALLVAHTAASMATSSSTAWMTRRIQMAARHSGE